MIIQKRKFTERMKKEIQEEYIDDETVSISSLSRKYKCSRHKIRVILELGNIKIRTPKEYYTNRRKYL
jgi:Mor family transcriptional regulator